MFSNQSKDKIISDTLSYVTTVKSFHRLIDETFDIRTGWCSVYYKNSAILNQEARYGLMNLKESEIRGLIRNYISAREKFINEITAATGVDVTKTDFKQLLEMLTTNMALQVLLTYFYYRYKGVTESPYDVEQIEELVWKTFNDDLDSDFYQSVFNIE